MATDAAHGKPCGHLGYVLRMRSGDPSCTAWLQRFRGGVSQSLQLFGGTHASSFGRLMIIRTFIVLLFIPLSASFAQTQRAMNDGAAHAAHGADSTLNLVYRQLEMKYRSDSVAFRKLQTAQQSWIVFRDAQIDATYPAIDRQKVYGSVLPTCISALVEELTRTRIAQLRQALHTAEGDVCAGGPA